MLATGRKNNPCCPSLEGQTIPHVANQKQASQGSTLTLFVFFTLLTGIIMATTAQVFAQSESLGPSCTEPNQLILPITKWTQGEAPWCWAATAAVAMDYHHKPYTPCSVVSTFSEGGVDCCTEQYASDQCMIEGTVQKALRHFGFTYTYEKIPNLDLSFSRISEELCTSGPFITRIANSSGFRHTIVVYGYAIKANNTLEVIVHDPQDETALPALPYDVFKAANGNRHVGKYISICSKDNSNCPPQ